MEPDPVDAAEALLFDTAAEEFGQHIKRGGDWHYAGLVARWVALGTGGRRATGASGPVRKRSAREFAESAQVSRNTVVRYLKAWNLAADEGHVTKSALIDPLDFVFLDAEHLPDWSDYFQRASRSSDVDEQVPAESSPEPEFEAEWDEARVWEKLRRQFRTAIRLAGTDPLEHLPGIRFDACAGAPVLADEIAELRGWLAVIETGLRGARGCDIDVAAVYARSRSDVS